MAGAERQPRILKNTTKDYNHFCRAAETLPERLQKNLENMPGNKGYKFRGVIFFGELPVSEETYIIFERVDKETMLIHTWEKDFSCVYEKKGKSKKALLEKFPKKSVKNSSSLKDFFKKSGPK